MWVSKALKVFDINLPSVFGNYRIGYINIVLTHLT